MCKHPVLARFLLALWISSCTPFALAWGTAGHRIINRVAMEALPADVPAFLHDSMTIGEVEALASEPDRWRFAQEPGPENTEAPHHYINLEFADVAAPRGLPADEQEFRRDLERAQRRNSTLAFRFTPYGTGMLPWQIETSYQRLCHDMNLYRQQFAAGQPVAAAQRTVVFDIAILGHYVADGSQPLHTTIDHDGWVEEQNPRNFTREHGVHSEFESEFVENNFRAADIRPLVPAEPRSLPNLFNAIVLYLRASHDAVPSLYRLEKQNGFAAHGTPEACAFTAKRLAAGATMLRDLIHSAWVESGHP